MTCTIGETTFALGAGVGEAFALGAGVGGGALGAGMVTILGVCAVIDLGARAEVFALDCVEIAATLGVTERPVAVASTSNVTFRGGC